MDAGAVRDRARAGGVIRRLLAALALIAALCSAPALAWGGFGHRTTAEIALANVRPETAARIRALIAVNKQLGTPMCHLHNLAEAATWPDCLRKEQWRWGFTAPWHFQNANICKPFDPKSDCANGNCVSAQIERNFRLLSDRTLPAVQRLEAMAFLVFRPAKLQHVATRSLGPGRGSLTWLDWHDGSWWACFAN